METIIKAIDTFDVDRDTVFGTHAHWQIKAAWKTIEREHESLVHREKSCSWKHGRPQRVDLDRPIDNENDGDEPDTIGSFFLSDPSAEDERGSLVIQLANAALDHLDDFGRRLFEARYCEEETVQSYAKLAASSFNYSDETLRQINNTNITRVRDKFFRRGPIWIVKSKYEGQTLRVVGHDAKSFIDEFYGYRERGIGHLRRRRDGHKVGGIQPIWQAKLIWHNGDCCTIVYRYSEVCRW
jgi:hypothetical protein